MIRRRRTKPRRGRLDAAGMASLRAFVFERDGGLCQHELPAHIVDGRIVVEEFWEKCLVIVSWEEGHLAHRISRGAGGHDTAENTYWCCAEHHNTFHRYGPSMTKPCPRKN